MAGDLRALLQPWADRPADSMVVVDFDGTLAPIVDNPDRARPLPAATGVLARLVDRLGAVAVVSGRPVAFLRRMLPLDGLVLVGQYGLERRSGTGIVVHPQAEAFRDAVEAAARRVHTELPGIAVERKAGLACTLHWRTAPELGPAAAALGRRLASEYGLATHPGRLALELRPPVDCDKGTVVADLARGRHAVLMAGDDHGDVAALRAISRLVDAGLVAYGLRVAVGSDEAPPALVDEADVRVDGPASLVGLLELLVEMLGCN